MRENNESMGQDGRRKMWKIVNKPRGEETGGKVEQKYQKDLPDAVQTVWTSETRTGLLLCFDFHFLRLFMSNNPPTPTFSPHLHFVYLALSTPSYLSSLSPLVTSSILLSFYALFYAIPALSFNLLPKTQHSLRAIQRETCLAVHPHDFFSSRSLRASPPIKTKENLCGLVFLPFCLDPILQPRGPTANESPERYSPLASTS